MSLKDLRAILLKIELYLYHNNHSIYKKQRRKENERGMAENQIPQNKIAKNLNENYFKKQHNTYLKQETYSTKGYSDSLWKTTKK